MTSRLSCAVLAALTFDAVPAGTGEGLTFGQVVHNVPHDAGAFVVYTLMLASVVLVWRAGRPSS